MHFDTEAQRQKTLNTVHKRKGKSQEYFTADYTAQRKTNTTDKINIKQQRFALDEKSHTGEKWNKYCENIKNIEQYCRKIIGKDIKKYFEKYRRGQATTDYWWRLWRKSVWEPQMCKAFDQSSKGGQWSTWFYLLKKN